MAQLLSLAIEDRAIKLLVVDGKQLKTAISLPLEPGLVKDGVVLDKVTVSQKIKKLLDTEKITTRKVIASVSGIHSLYRLIRLPRLPGNLLAEAVKREAERIIPMSLGELYLSWQAIPISSEETLVCLIGLPKNTVDSVIDTLRQAGLDPFIMDARPLAVARAAGEAQTIAINVEATDFDIILIINGIPELIRSLPFSREGLLPEAKAKEIKEELDRTVSFYSTSHKAEPISENMPLILGGDAEVSTMLTQKLSYPVKSVVMPFLQADSLNANDFMTNIGLLLKKANVNRVSLRLNFNTLPEIYLPKPMPILPILSGVLIVAAIGLLVWLGLSTRQAIIDTSALKTELAQVQSAIKARGFYPKEMSRLEAKLKEVTTVRDNVKSTLANLEQRRVRISGDLSQAISLLPASITLTNISHGTALTVTGIAPDGSTILSYANSLKESGRFSQVLVVFDTKAYQEVSFTLILK